MFVKVSRKTKVFRKFNFFTNSFCTSGCLEVTICYQLLASNFFKEIKPQEQNDTPKSLNFLEIGIKFFKNLGTCFRFFQSFKEIILRIRMNYHFCLNLSLYLQVCRIFKSNYKIVNLVARLPKTYELNMVKRGHQTWSKEANLSLWPAN